MNHETPIALKTLDRSKYTNFKSFVVKSDGKKEKSVQNLFSDEQYLGRCGTWVWWHETPVLIGGCFDQDVF